MRGDFGAAVDAFKEGLTCDHAKGEAQKALLYELATAREAMGEGGKALSSFQKVAKLDAKYREVGASVTRLSASAKPEDDPLPPKKAGAKAAPASAAKAPVGKARNVGYV